MPSSSTPTQNIDDMNKTISKLRDEVASLRETVNMLLELVIEHDEGDYEEAPANPWEALAVSPQGLFGAGM